MTTNSFSWPDNKRAAVSLSFDDARLTQIDKGIPLLEELGVRGTFYVSFWGVEQRLDAWRAAVARGHEVGNHTVLHPCSINFHFHKEHVLENLTLHEIETDILDANERIEQLLGVHPTTFAYPCGQKFVGRGENVRSYVPVVARHFRVGRGFKEEYHNDPACCDLAQISGYNLDLVSFDQIKPYLDDGIQRGAWMVFVGHEMIEGTRQTVRRETLEELCAYIRNPANAVWSATVGEVGEYIHKNTARL